MPATHTFTALRKISFKPMRESPIFAIRRNLYANRLVSIARIQEQLIIHIIVDATDDPYIITSYVYVK